MRCLALNALRKVVISQKQKNKSNLEQALVIWPLEHKAGYKTLPALVQYDLEPSRSEQPSDEPSIEQMRN